MKALELGGGEKWRELERDVESPVPELRKVCCSPDDLLLGQS